MTPVRLQTHVWNPLGERRALLLHGLGSDGQTWWRLASELADDGYLVLAPDLRSHGRSPTAADHSLEAMSADVLLLDPVLVVDDELREELRRELREDVVRTDADELRRQQPRWDERDVQRKLLATASVTPDVVDAVFDHNPRWDLTAMTAQVRARLHLLAADPAEGALLEPHLLDQLIDGERVTGETVQGCGHGIHRERPDVVTDAVARLTSRGVS